MSALSVGELVKLAKGEDRSLREYARDSGVDAAIISKIINGTYIPKKPGIYESLTNAKASPRGGVTCAQMIAAAGASEEFQNGMSAGMSVGMLTSLAAVPSSVILRVLQSRGIDADAREKSKGSASSVKPEEVRQIQRIQSEMQRFKATANGMILGALGKKGLSFQLVHTDGAEIDGIHFDTDVKLMNHEVSEYLIRYAFIFEENPSSLLAINEVKSMIEELVFLKPLRTRIVSVVTNHPDAYDSLCAYKDRLSYNGELSVILFSLENAMFVKEEYISHHIGENPVDEIYLI